MRPSGLTSRIGRGPKRQRTAALQDVDAQTERNRFPPGLGVRLSSAALDFHFSAISDLAFFGIMRLLTASPTGQLTRTMALMTPVSGFIQSGNAAITSSKFARW